jgi:hypothetical protein
MHALRLDSGILRGTIGEKAIECRLRTSRAIPAGEYMLLPAVQDAVYGLAVQLVPVAARSGAARADKHQVGQSGVPKAIKVAAIKFDRPAAGKVIDAGPSPTGALGTFVFSAKALPGRNSVAVERGFSDLVDALQNGPLAVTVG